MQRVSPGAPVMPELFAMSTRLQAKLVKALKDRRSSCLQNRHSTHRESAGLCGGASRDVCNVSAAKSDAQNAAISS